jgi:DNA-binding MarR family transcriptional regulator
MDEPTYNQRPQTTFTRREAQAWSGFLRAHALIARQLDIDLERAHRLPLSSYEALRHLAWAPEGRMRITDLAAACLLSQSGGSRLIERLIREGLVEKTASAEDGRGAYAVITQVGQARLDEAQASHIASVRARFLDHFSDDELATMAAFWERILAAKPEQLIKG